MKKVIYILSVVFLAVLSACTEDSMLQQGPDGSGKDGYVKVHFTLEDMPDFQAVETKAGETGIDKISLINFDKDGNFLGCVETTNIARTTNNEATGAATGTGSALIPIDTKIIHFVANWNGDMSQLSGTEKTIMPTLISSDPYVAWGRVENITDYQHVSVTLLRNYAKVTVESTVKDFEVGGFALVNFVKKGTLVTWDENKGTFDNVTNSDNSKTEITQIPSLSGNMGNQSAADCLNTNPKYMFEYINNYNNQTSVIIKKKGANQYYKIQLIDKDGVPFKIERNYVYKVVIVKFAAEATGSPSFEEASKAAPTNNIYAEVTKDAPTISDADGNKMTVTPLTQLFTTSGTAVFSARYWEQNTLALSKVRLQTQSDAQKLLGTPGYVDSNGTVQVSVTKPAGMQDGDLYLANILVQAGILSRIVTIYVSNQYSFEPVVGDTYSKLGDKVTLKFTIPETFPKELYPLKCRIEANDLNPDNSVAGQKPMLIEHIDGKYYYIYEAQGPGEQVLHFVTTRSTVENPTVSNEYFALGTFEMVKNIPERSISGTLRYATNAGSSNPANGAAVSWKSGNQYGSFNMKNNGGYTFSVKADDSDEITFSYTLEKTNGQIEYEGTFLISELNSKTVTLQPKRIIGKIEGYQSGDITVNKASNNGTKGDEYGSIEVVGGSYYYSLPNNFSWNEYVGIYQGNKLKITRKRIRDWINNTDLKMSLTN